MKLLDIEINGFKSFANTVKIPIDKDLIAFIGPNGCGKSNIADAIKWVLGEQNPREIRCERQSDVIFSGSELKAAQGLAEVTLRLSNEDKKIPLNYNEIEITRRLYKSGESEYLLNRTPVRLKDISKLLSGTGLGESSYSLFKASVIDELLKPNSTLINDLLSEASGIAKYKLDKKETIKKIQSTKDALKRVEDIIFEVSERLNNLKRQADRTKRYNNLKEKIEIKEKLYLIKKAKELKLEIDNTINGIDELTSKEKIALKDIESIEIKKKESNQQITDINTKRESIFKDLSNLNKKLNEITSNKSHAIATIENLEGNISSIGNIIEEIENSVPKQKEYNKNIKLEIEKINKVLTKIDISINEKEEALKNIAKSVASMENALKEKDNNFRELQESIIEKGKELEGERRTYSFNEERIDALNEELASKINESDEIGEMIPEYEDKLADQLNIAEKLKGEISILNNKVVEISNEIETKKRKLQEDKEQVISLKKEFDILNEMEINNEGLGNGAIKFKKRGKKLLTESIEVKGGYEKAVEMTLSNIVDAIVVKDEKDLKDHVQTALNDNMSGICFVVRNIEKGGIEQYIIKGKEFIPIYLKNTIIVKDINDIDISSDIPQVTKNGRIFYFRGVLNVGDKRNITLIGRKKHIEKLQNVIENKKKSIDSIEGTIKKLIENQDEIMRGVGGKEKKAKEYSEAITRIEEEIRHLQNSYEAINLIIDEIRTDKSEHKENIVAIGERITMLEKTLKVEKDELPDIQESRDQLRLERGKFDKLNENRQNLLIEKLKTEHSINIKIKELDNNKNKIQKMLNEKEEYSNQIQKLLEKIEEKKSKKEELIIDEGKVEDEIDGLRKRDLDMRNNIEKFNIMINDFDEKHKILDENRNSVKETLNNFRIEKETGGMKLANTENKLKNRYGIDPFRSDIETEEEIWSSDKIERMREKLLRMEPINLLALKEYDETEKRLNFLIEQKNDLLGSEESLLKTIKLSDKKAKEDFEKTFVLIKGNFNKFFTELFNGGKSDIIIENADDPVESMIVVYAQPPDKKIYKMQMLSTGEKTLTAIALLFAIYQTNPSPFCFMDEVDAPLDDVNIERFIILLSRIKENSQIMMITHNRRTMEICEYMYGVTMAEGISKIVSINLKKEMEEWD